MAWNAAALLLAIIAISALFTCVNSQSVEHVNTFEVNLRESIVSNEIPQKNDFTPPTTINSTFKWESSTFGQCYGCGSKSYKEVNLDCIHRQPMQLSVGNYSKTVMGVFKATKAQCRNIQEPARVRVVGCGPPCSELRLLRGANTGCRCNHERQESYDVPKLICQDNRNQTKPLALCKDFYDKNPTEYATADCEYKDVCSGEIGWILGNWSECRTHTAPLHQTRDVACASAKLGNVHYFMHESECKETRPQKVQFCARWRTVINFTCDCATKRSTRPVYCVRKPYTHRINEAECSWYPKPESERPCDEEQLNNCVKPRLRWDGEIDNI